MLDLIPMFIDNVVIREDNGEHILNLPDDMDGLKFRNWLKKPGGKFSADFLRWIREKGEAKYFIIKGQKMQTVIRLISKEELIYFNALGLYNGKLKDSTYMHLKTVGINQNIRGSERYIDESMNSGKQIKTESEINETSDDEKAFQSESLFE